MYSLLTTFLMNFSKRQMLDEGELVYPIAVSANLTESNKTNPLFSGTVSACPLTHSIISRGQQRDKESPFSGCQFFFFLCRCFLFFVFTVFNLSVVVFVGKAPF